LTLPDKVHEESVMMTERFDTFSPPSSGEPDWETVPAVEAADGDGILDAREAAVLLEQTTRQAEREFEVRPPWLILTAAPVVFVAYGVIWLSVRNQHPYVGPAGWALGVLYGTLAVWIVLNVVVLGHRLGGRSSAQRRFEGIMFASIWISVYIFEGALGHEGVSKGVAYGVWPAIAPLIVVGAAASGYAIAREKRAEAILALGAVLVGTGAAFAGPTGVWAVVAIGLSTLCLIGGGVQFWQRRS
jgi:hypothetical protein